MTGKNFINQILEEVKEQMQKANVNREFKQINALDAVRIDVFFNNMDDIKRNKATFKTTFNKLLSNKKDKLETIVRLEKYLKILTKEIKTEEEL